MKTSLTVVIGLLVGTVLLACASNTPHVSPEIEDTSRSFVTIDEIKNPNLTAQESMVKIEIATKGNENISSGVIVGDGHFAVTYLPEVSDDSIQVNVIHVGSNVATSGSIIYIDEAFGLVLIRLTDDLGKPVVISQVRPNQGEELIVGDFFPIKGEDLVVTRQTKVTGFEFDGLVMRFDGILGSGNAGGPVLNGKGRLVGIVTHGLGEGQAGIVLSPETFKYGLAEELVKYKRTVMGNTSRYELDLIGIPAQITKPSDWSILSGFGYFDIRAPKLSNNSEDPSSNEYKVIGITNADSYPGETSEEVLNRLIAEFGKAFKRVREFVLPEQYGLDKCVLLTTVEEYSRTAFERRGHVLPGGWVSHPGIYTGICTGVGKNQRVIVFAESHDLDDIVNIDGLFKNIALVP